MLFKYETSPTVIEQHSFRRIRDLTNLSMFEPTEQQVVMRIVHSLGLPELAEKIRFSNHACKSGCLALEKNSHILCDVEMVKQGITKRLISQPPLCFLNEPSTTTAANATGKTRSMAAVDFWHPYIKDSVVLIGNAPTALFRLLEMLEQGIEKPALVIGMPVGFIGAEESKQALWQCHQSLGIECITILGRQGGSSATAASCNALLRCNNGEWY